MILLPLPSRCWDYKWLKLQAVGIFSFLCLQSFPMSCFASLFWSPWCSVLALSTPQGLSQAGLCYTYYWHAVLSPVTPPLWLPECCRLWIDTVGGPCLSIGHIWLLKGYRNGWKISIARWEMYTLYSWRIITCFSDEFIIFTFAAIFTLSFMSLVNYCLGFSLL